MERKADSSNVWDNLSSVWNSSNELEVLIPIFYPQVCTSDCTPAEIKDALIRCFQDRDLNTYYQIPFVPGTSYNTLCGNTTCLTWCFQNSVIAPCYQGSSDMVHLGNGDALKAAYMGFCNNNDSQTAQNALACAENVSNQDVLNLVSVFQTKLEGYYSTFIVNGNTVCSDWQTMLNGIYSLFETPCAADNDTVTYWKTFLNTVYAPCDKSISPSWYEQYRNETNICGNSASSISMWDYRQAPLLVVLTCYHLYMYQYSAPDLKLFIC